MQIGDKIENIKTINQNNKEIMLNEYLDENSKYLILYFYPKDNTPGCTNEANNFNNELEKFNNLKAKIVGVSPDDSVKHCKFIEKHNLNFDLICDTNLELCNKFKVWQLKKFMGREYMGVVRSTFILDKQLNLLAIFNKVKVKEHTQEVLDALDKIINNKEANNG